MRGEMSNVVLATQPRDYSALRYGKITPTDIDGLLDFKNKVWVIFELKHGNAPLPFGQRLAIERLVDDLSSVKPSIGFVASHNHQSSEDIDASNSIVTSFRYKNKWVDDTRAMTLRQAIDSFLYKHGISIDK